MSVLALYKITEGKNKVFKLLKKGIYKKFNPSLSQRLLNQLPVKVDEGFA